MTATVFDGCTDACGWVAAVVAALTYGSYGVTIKEASKVGVEVSPLVMQTYKTAVFFLMCPLVVFLGEDLSWAPTWGLLSGALWVPGATFGIYGVQMAGMATAEGVWSSVIVMVNFVCLVLFGEHVKSLGETVCAFVLLTVGLVGMSKYSAPNATAPQEEYTSPSLHESCSNGGDEHHELLHSTSQISLHRSRTGGRTRRELSPKRSPMSEQSSANNSDDDDMVVVSRRKRKGSAVGTDVTDLEMAPLSGRFVIPENLRGSFEEIPPPQPAGEKGPKDRIRLFGGLVLTRRQAGIVGAALNGLFGGTSLIPMHYAAKEGYSGARYFVSFATGSMIVQVIWWVGLVGYRIGLNRGSVRAALTNLPEFHFRKVWLPLFLSGILFSIGMLGSIIAVAYLGQGIGNTFVQCKILIAGLWGIVYYQEIWGVSTITKFFLSAVFALLGILALSHEHSHIPHH